MAHPLVTYIEDETIRNTNYRKVIYTGKFQVVLMSLIPGEDIPEEIHQKLDQFIRVESGKGTLTIWKGNLSPDADEYFLEDGISAVIPAGIRHYIKNTDSKDPLKLYSIYSEPEHSPNRIDVDKPLEEKVEPELSISGLSISGLELLEAIRYPDRYQDWDGISRNPNITMEDIDSHPNLPWNWGYISLNPNLTMDFILSHPDKPWNWRFISSHPNITMEDILSYPDKPWNWGGISKNPNITMEYIDSNPDFPWVWKYIYENPNITPELVDTRYDDIFWAPYWEEARRRQPMIKPAWR